MKLIETFQQNFPSFNKKCVICNKNKEFKYNACFRCYSSLVEFVEDIYKYRSPPKREIDQFGLTVKSLIIEAIIFKNYFDLRICVGILGGYDG
ncbi:unnamed protein product, partial [marine sediment metagenome]